MTKFNQRSTKSAVQSPIHTDRRPTGTTGEGGPGYARNPQSELFLLAVSNMVGERTFYETADHRDERYETLIHQVAVADPQWTAGFLGWLRGEGNMRSASLVGALESARAMLAKGIPGSRQIVASVLQRADEPGEALAYWTSRYGRSIPKPVKRGVADAVGRLYTEYNLLKYDTASKGFRFADVLDLVHPAPVAPWQGDLFRYALERRHNREDQVPDLLMMVRANEVVRVAASEGDYAKLLDPDWLRKSGMTWEDVLSLAGAKVPKRALWTALIPSMGYMALLRNLRNFDEVGIGDDIAATVATRLSDPEQVARSRQFPFRFLAAHRNVPSLRWGHALDKALTASLANVPVLKGRTLILVDLSGSMYDRASEKSQLNRADSAKVFGAALAMRTDPTLIAYDTNSQRISVPQGGSLLKLVDSFPQMGGGTYTAATVQRWYSGHNRVVILTDEQSAAGDPGAHVPKDIPVYTWNLAGYRMGNMAGAANRFTFGGLSDAAFRMIALIEGHRDAKWPWL